MKKKVYVNLFLSKNLGDDLFLKLLCDRYNEQFYISTALDYNLKISNLTINRINFKDRIIRKFYHLLNKDNAFKFKYIRKCDLSVTIGGSLFIEKFFNDYDTYNYCKKNGIKTYILGSNIGPYKTQEFIDRLKKDVFPKVNDICLRDKQSFQLFESLKNVRYAPDIVFGYDFEKYKKIKEEKKVLVSVINCSKKVNQINNISSEKYENKILEISRYFISLGYKIQFMSFCQDEGDEETIRNITEKLDINDYSVYCYRDNIEEALEVIASSNIVIGSRFHANVIGLAMGKTIIPISYNSKTINMLNDIDFKGIKINLDEIHEFDVNLLTPEVLNYKCDVSKYIIEAEKHFEKLDNELERN